MNFEYLITTKKEQSIDIKNIGTCALDAYNDLGFEYLLIIKTREGLTEIIEYGPLIPDLEYLPANVSYTYNRIDFSESKIIKRINKFLVEGCRGITQVFEIELEEAKEKIRNLVDFVDVSE